MFKHVDYDADRVETYLIFQKAFSREDKSDLIEKLKKALTFISQRDQEWTLVIFREGDQNPRELEGVAAEFFLDLDAERKQRFHKPTFLYWDYSSPSDEVVHLFQGCKGELKYIQNLHLYIGAQEDKSDGQSKFAQNMLQQLPISLRQLYFRERQNDQDFAGRARPQ